MRVALLFLLILLAVSAAEAETRSGEETKSEAPAENVSHLDEEIREILQMRELLEMLELLEDMDILVRMEEKE